MHSDDVPKDVPLFSIVQCSSDTSPFLFFLCGKDGKELHSAPHSLDFMSPI
jgi:hypothetical protein